MHIRDELIPLSRFGSSYWSAAAMCGARYMYVDRRNHPHIASLPRCPECVAVEDERKAVAA